MAGATTTAEEIARLSGVKKRAAEQVLHKWRWLGHVARRTDDRWSKFLLDWSPEEPSRRPSHPALLCEDDIQCFFQHRLHIEGEKWKIFAQELDGWQNLAIEVANHVPEMM